MEQAEQLCLACGLCCDGTLFGHVKLVSGDDASKLKAHGLSLVSSRSRPPLVRFRQPCAALCPDRKCRVYTDRPSQCRNYECGVYQAFQAGKIGFPAALRTVTDARRKADKVRRLLRKLGETDEQCSLDERFNRVHARVESGDVAPDDGHVFAELTQAVHTLHLLAHKAFYTRLPPGK